MSKLSSAIFIHDPYFLLQIEGSTPSDCWNEIYRRIRKMQESTPNCFNAEGGVERIYESGSDMFGFSNPEVIKLIKVCQLVFLTLNFQKLHLVYADANYHCLLLCVETFFKSLICHSIENK